MSKIPSVVMILAVLMSSSGAARAYVKDSKGGGASADSGSPFETRVYVRPQCILSEPSANQRELFGALLGIFVPLLIEKALGGVSSALKKAGAAETLKDSGRLPTYLYELSSKSMTATDGTVTDTKSTALNPNLGCVIVVRGTFSGPDTGRQTVVAFPDGDSGVLDQAGQEQQRINRLRQSNITVNSIAVAYEAAIRKSNDQTAFHYESRFLEVNSFQGTRSGDSRALVISLAIHGAGEKEGEPTLSLALVNLGAVRKGSIKGPQQFGSQRTGWLSGLGVTDGVEKAIEKMKLDDGQTALVMPITFEGTIAETEKGSAALRFIAEVLDSTKGEVSKAVSGEILKDRGAEAQKKSSEAADALEKLRQEEEETYAAHLKAKAELAEASLPADATPAQKAAYEVKQFEQNRTKRLWCVKYWALDSAGAAPSGRKCE